MSKRWEDEAVEELNRLTGRGARQKRDAIIAVVSAKMTGAPVSSVFDSPNRPCDDVVFYRWSSQDKVFRSVLEAVERIAYSSVDRAALQDLKIARRRLASASASAVLELMRLMRNSNDDKVRLSAANSILDRASFDLLKDDENDGNTARRAVVNSDTMAALIQEAMSRRGSMIEEPGE